MKANWLLPRLCPLQVWLSEGQLAVSETLPRASPAQGMPIGDFRDSVACKSGSVKANWLLPRLYRLQVRLSEGQLAASETLLPASLAQ